MTNNSLLSPNNILNNSVENINVVNITMNNGVMTGNIIDEPINTAEECPTWLIFNCKLNSQYLPII